MTEQATWMQTYGWIIAAAIIIIAAAVPFAIRKCMMSKKQRTPAQPDTSALIRQALQEENDLLTCHRSELLLALRTSAQRDRLRSVDLSISASWFSSGGIQLAVDAMLEAIQAALDAGDDIPQLRAGVVNPYILPIRIRLLGLRRALDEAQRDCWPIPDDADLRLFLELSPLRPTDSASAILQKTGENQRLIRQKLQLHGYNVQYDRLLTALLDVFDGDAAHTLDEDRAADRAACCAALMQITHDIARIRQQFSRP